MKGRSLSHFLAGTPGAKDSGPEAARVWGLAHILALGSRKRVVGPYPGRLALVERRGVSLAAPDVPLTLFFIFPYRVTLILSLEQLQPCEQTGAFFREGVGRLPLLHFLYPS